MYIIKYINGIKNVTFIFILQVINTFYKYTPLYLNISKK